jgi:hypothetical protein
MAKGRVRSRLELREQYDAAEARERDERTGDEEAGDEEPDVADEPSDDDAAPAPVKKKKKAAAPKESKPRKKTVKVVRRRVVWVVLDNSNKRVAQYDYTKKQEADEHALRLATEKKQTYFVQPVKEEIAE